MGVLAGEAFGDAGHDYLRSISGGSILKRKRGQGYVFGGHEGEFFLDAAANDFGVDDEAGCDVVYTQILVVGLNEQEG